MIDSQIDNFGSSNIPQEKKNWVSPDLNVWSANNLELGGGSVADGGSKGYVG